MYYCPNIEFHSPLPEEGPGEVFPLPGEVFRLSEEESQHCVRVLRSKAGDLIDVTDGVGHIFHCRITNPSQHHCEVEILSTESPAPLHAGHVHVAIAPTKNMDRIEWFVEKATEMGVDEITFLLCEHSERKTINLERIRKVMVAAAKQSLKTTYPRLNDMTRIMDLTPAAGDTDWFIAHCEDGYAASETRLALRDNITRGHDVTILIGPEGDFSPSEIAWALSHGYRPISLGAARLRTETAGLVACHTAILLNE